VPFAEAAADKPASIGVVPISFERPAAGSGRPATPGAATAQAGAVG
jgi:hypothetical protein